MHKITLHIIDDEPEVVRAITALFKPDKRYRVRPCSSVSELLADVEQNPPQLVICDYRMPEMDGMTLLSRLKERFPRLRSILLTGQAFGPEIAAGIEQGVFNDYSGKPYNAQTLKETARRLAREVAKEALQ